MTDLREYISDHYISHVAFDLKTLLNYLDELYTDYQGEDELERLIEDETDSYIDKPEFIRNNIEVSCINLLEHYGVMVDPDIPTHTLVGVLKPIVLFGNSAVRDLWYSIDTEQTDNVDAYVTVARDVFEFIQDPMVFINDVSDNLIEAFTDEDEIILPMINNGLYRNNLRTFLKRYPSDVGATLMSTQIDVGIKIEDYAKLYFSEDMENDMLENNIKQYVVDLMCIAFFTHTKMRKVIGDLQSYIEDRYAGEAIVIDLHKTLTKITKGYKV